MSLFSPDTWTRQQMAFFLLFLPISLPLWLIGGVLTFIIGCIISPFTKSQ